MLAGNGPGRQSGACGPAGRAGASDPVRPVIRRPTLNAHCHPAARVEGRMQPSTCNEKETKQLDGCADSPRMGLCLTNTLPAGYNLFLRLASIRRRLIGQEAPATAED